MSTHIQYCHLLTQIPNVKISQYAYNTYKLTILMQGNDIEMNPGPTQRPTTTVQGNFHQCDQKEFQSRSAGKQCVTNSIIVLSRYVHSLLVQECKSKTNVKGIQ